MRIFPLIVAFIFALGTIATVSLAQVPSDLTTTEAVSAYCASQTTTLADCEDAIDALLAGLTGEELQSAVAALVAQLQSYYVPGTANPLLADKIAYLGNFAVDPDQQTLIGSISDSVRNGEAIDTGAVETGQLASPN
ncbi:MAG: hypothetical protein KKH72_08655 [Alphaproteobacteria bacterium]|nr:hypothetical protein [Alphaproteobacteria bacterium]